MFDYAAIHVGFKRFFCELWVLWLQLLCAGMWVLSDFMYWESTSVHRHVGFKRFYGLRAHISCTGMWVL